MPRLMTLPLPVMLKTGATVGMACETGVAVCMSCEMAPGRSVVEGMVLLLVSLGLKSTAHGYQIEPYAGENVIILTTNALLMGPSVS